MKILTGAHANAEENRRNGKRKEKRKKGLHFFAQFGIKTAPVWD